MVSGRGGYRLSTLTMSADDPRRRSAAGRGLTPDESVWDTTTFTENRDSPLEGTSPRRSPRKSSRPPMRGICSRPSTSPIDGTLLEGWAKPPIVHDTNPRMRSMCDCDPAVSWLRRNSMDASKARQSITPLGCPKLCPPGQRYLTIYRQRVCGTLTRREFYNSVRTIG